MEMFYAIAIIAFTVPVAIVLPIIYGVYFGVIKKKEGWRENPFAWPDWVTPFAVAFLWLVLHYFGVAKGFGNVVFDPFCVGLLWCVAWIVRLWKYSRITENKLRVAWEMLGITIAVTITLTLFIPYQSK